MFFQISTDFTRLPGLYHRTKVDRHSLFMFRDRATFIHGRRKSTFAEMEICVLRNISGLRVRIMKICNSSDAAVENKALDKQYEATRGILSTKGRFRSTEVILRQLCVSLYRTIASLRQRRRLPPLIWCCKSTLTDLLILALCSQAIQLALWTPTVTLL